MSESEKRVIFDEEDFIKIGEGDTIIFDEDFLGKDEEQIIRVELEWNGEPDLDISAIMLNASRRITKKADLVFYGSERRWKTDNMENPFDGEVSLWDDCSAQYKNRTEWLGDTMPISLDDSVIGSWDDRGAVDPDAVNSEVLHIQLDKIDIRKYRSVAIIATINLPTKKDANGRKRMLEGLKFKDVVNPVVRIYDAIENRLLLEYKMDNKSPDADAVCCGYMQYNEDKRSWEFQAAEVGYCGRRDGEYYKGGIMLIANSFA